MDVDEKGKKLFDEFTDDRIFKLWKAEVKNEGYYDAYQAADQYPLIERLICMFYNHDIELDTVEMYKRKIYDTLMLGRKEAQQGRGKYKLWPETLRQHIENAIAYVYLSGHVNDELVVPKSLKTQEKIEYDKDQEVVDWAQGKFSGACSEDLIAEAHKVGTILNMEFLTDTFVV